MGVGKPLSPSEPSEPSGSEQLDSWKEIAAYLKRDESTVRRWEKEGLPVHRHVHKKKATVYAYKPEIDVWWKDGCARLESREAAAAGRPRRPAWWGAAGVALVALLAVLVGLNVGGWRERLFGASSKPIRSLAVLPLENLSGDPEQEYFADGMTEALITELGKIRALRVISHTSVMRYKNVEKSVPEIAAELGVDAVIEGAAAREGNEVRITVQLIHGTSDTHLWANSYQQELGSMLALQSEVARAIAREIKVEITPAEQARLAQARRVNPEAQVAYLLGAHHEFKTNPEDVRKARQYLETAVRLDPDHAQAWGLLAHVYADHPHWLELAGENARAPLEESWAKAERAARRALAIDESEVGANLALAEVLIRRDRNWLAAERELRRAEEVAPNVFYVHVLIARYLTSVGRHQEALSHALRAVELAPTDPSVYFRTAVILYHARRYEESLEYARLGIDVEPMHWGAHVALAQAYGQLGRYDEAIQSLQQLGVDRPNAVLGYLYAKAGRTQDALRMLEDAEQVGPGSSFNSYDRAAVYVGLGDHERALAMLQQAHEEKSWRLALTLRVDPIWDPLRSDPRFHDLLRRMNFPED